MKKKILAGCLAVVLLLGIGSAMHFGAPARWEGQAAEISHAKVPSWLRWRQTNFGALLTDLASKQAQSALEAKVDTDDAEYDRTAALAQRESARARTAEETDIRDKYVWFINWGYQFIKFGTRPSDIPTTGGNTQPSTQPTTTPVTSTTPTTTPTTPSATPSPTPSTSQRPKPSYPSSGNVSGALTDHYTYEATNGSWWTWRMQSDTYIWLDGSLDGVDAGSLNGTQLVLDVDGDSLTVAALALVDEQAGTYALQFHLSDAQYMALMNHFYQGGDKIPMELRSSAGLGLSGEPTVYLVMEQNGYSFKTGIYVS